MAEEEKDQQVSEEHVEDPQTDEAEQTVETVEAETTNNPDQEVEEVKDEDNQEDLSPEIKRLEKEKEELKTRVLRIQADYDNFRRRTKEERAADSKYRAQSLAEKLLPALDNFERALDMKAEGEEAKSLLEGMKMVYRQLKDGLEQENVKEIEAKGKPFDPEFHQAVMQVDNEEYEPNTVVEVMQKGYTLGDRVIRPAMVKVTG
ncbi:MAG TPA: nucleotide exchange factor GrpE [Bacillales bacterium]|nr:nucleotide exchange factor GrpE [Bacillales bacterium]